MTKEDLLKLKQKLNELSSEEKKPRDLYLRGLSNGEIQGPMTGVPSIDKVWLKYYDTVFDDRNIPNCSIYQFIEYANRNNMKNTAIDIRTSQNGFEKGIKITYETFFRRIKNSAKASVQLGIKTNDIVPIILPNIPEARILIYSNSIIGSISYPISPMLPANELERIINENNIKTVFIFEPFYQKYGKVLSNTKLDHIVLLDGSESLPTTLKVFKQIKDCSKKSNEKLFKSDNRIISWQQYCKKGRLEKKDIIPYYEDNHVSTIIGTSGTTGTSKGVCLTDHNINTVACSYRDGKIFEGTFLDALLPSIGYGISMIHYQTVTGKYVYLIPELLTTKFPEALKKLRPNNFPGGPVHYLNLLNNQQVLSNSQQYKNFVSGGATLPRSVEKELNKVSENYEEIGINQNLIVRQGLGLSEDAALCSYNKIGAYKFGSVGIPMAYVDVGIFKPGTDEELGYGCQGELCISSPATMKEYLNNPSETDNIIHVHSDGKRWIHTQDIVYIDETGHLFHIDRTKNIFMRTGFNVHPTKISEFINEIPLVKNSVVIGFDHPEEQCVPIAFIVLDELKTEGMSIEEVETKLRKICFENLEETSIPYDFVFTNDLPINPGGKIDIPRIKKESEIDLISKPKVKKRINFTTSL